VALVFTPHPRRKPCRSAMGTQHRVDRVSAFHLQRRGGLSGAPGQTSIRFPHGNPFRPPRRMVVSRRERMVGADFGGPRFWNHCRIDVDEAASPFRKASSIRRVSLIASSRCAMAPSSS
jgi:hypothetical protein